MNFQTGRQNLSGSFKGLKTEWHILREQWQDKKAGEFQKNCIDKLERDIHSSLKAIEEIDTLFKQLQEDCF
jgi:hypothetical protein